MRASLTVTSLRRCTLAVAALSVSALIAGGVHAQSRSSGQRSTSPLATSPPPSATTQAPSPAPAAPSPGLSGPQQAAPQAQPIAPLSPQSQPPIASGGGRPGSSSLALSPGDSGSPSQSAPSTPGGGGNSVDDCMGFWDAGTHMSKQEWKAACRRVQHRLDNLSMGQIAK